MEDVLFHATLISEITDHSKFMDRDFVYVAFMSWRGLVAVNVVVAAVVVCLFVCLLLFFLSDSQIDNAKQWSFALIIIVNWAQKTTQVPSFPSLFNFIPSTD